MSLNLYHCYQITFNNFLSKISDSWKQSYDKQRKKCYISLCPV